MICRSSSVLYAQLDLVAVVGVADTTAGKSRRTRPWVKDLPVHRHRSERVEHCFLPASLVDEVRPKHLTSAAHRLLADTLTKLFQQTTSSMGR
jgi:hypothetical protein